jgi:GAF domain-containing protein
MGLSKFFRNLNIGVKLSIVVALALVISLITTAIVMSGSVRDLTAQTGRQRAYQETEIVQSRFEEAEQKVLAAANLLANNPALIEAVANRDVARIRTAALVGAFALGLDGIDVVDSDGAYLITVLEEREILYTAQEDALISFALLGIDITGVIVEEEEQKLRLAAAAPLRDTSGAIVGALLASREADDELLKEINLSREDVHLVLIADEYILAQDLPKSEWLEEFSAVLLEETAIGQALSGQTLVADDLLLSTDGIPYALAYTPLTVHDETYAAIGILVDLRGLSVFQRQLMINTIIMLISLALVVGIIFTLFARRYIAVPIDKLRLVAERMASGDYQQRAEATTTDEIGQLAGAFNNMVAQLQQTLAGLEQRTADLQHRSAYLQASAEVSHAATSILDADQLIRQVVELIRGRFDLYYVGLFMVDGKWAVLRAGTDEAGRVMLARGHRIRVGEGVIGWSIANARARVALEAGEDAVRLATAELPETRSEAAIPMRSRGQVLGAITVQHTQPGAFDQDTIVVLQTLADQVAVALDNARLFAESQATLEAERRAYGELSRQVWSELLRAQSNLGVLRDERGISPAGDGWRAEMETALRTGQTTRGEDDARSLAMPIKVRGQVIGVVDARKPQDTGEWTQEQVGLLETLTEQLSLALENARLYQDTQRRATRERLTGEVTARMRESLDVEAVLNTAVREIGQALGLAALDVRLGAELGLGGNEDSKLEKAK